jgi:hypothetical protein
LIVPSPIFLEHEATPARKKPKYVSFPGIEAFFVRLPFRPYPSFIPEQWPNNIG